MSGKARGFSVGLVLLLSGQQSCATARPHEIAGEAMVAAGLLGVLAGLGAASDCDPADGADCRYTRVSSETYAPALIGGGLVLVVLGVVAYLAPDAHGSSTVPPPVAPPPPPQTFPPSPIEPLPPARPDQRL